MIYLSIDSFYYLILEAPPTPLSEHLRQVQNGVLRHRLRRLHAPGMHAPWGQAGKGYAEGGAAHGLPNGPRHRSQGQVVVVAGGDGQHKVEDEERSLRMRKKWVRKRL